MKNSFLVLERGEKFYEWGKILIKVWAAAWALLLLMMLVSLTIDSEGILYLLSFDMGEDYWYAYPLLFASYLGILFGPIGLVLYISGLHLIGLGEIAINTEKEEK